MTALELGESAERFVVNLINIINKNRVIAEVINNKYDKLKNHEEGDINIKVSYDFKDISKLLADMNVDVKASDKYDDPAINIEYYDKETEKYVSSVKYLNALTHDFYLAVGKYNKNEIDFSQKVKYALIKTKDFKNYLLTPDGKEISANCKKIKKPSYVGAGDWVKLSDFPNNLVFRSTDIYEVLRKMYKWKLNIK